MTAPNVPEEAVKAALARWSNVPERAPEADVRGMLEAALPSIIDSISTQPKEVPGEIRFTSGELSSLLDCLPSPAPTDNLSTARRKLETAAKPVPGAAVFGTGKKPPEVVGEDEKGTGVQALLEALEFIDGCFVYGKRKTYGDPDETLDRIREKAHGALAMFQAAAAQQHRPKKKATDEIRRDLDEAISIVERCGANGSRVAPSVAYSLRDAFATLTQPPVSEVPGEAELQKRIDQAAQEIAREHALFDGDGNPNGTAIGMARKRVARELKLPEVPGDARPCGECAAPAGLLHRLGCSCSTETGQEVPGNSGGVEEGVIWAVAEAAYEADRQDHMPPFEQVEPGPNGGDSRAGYLKRAEEAIHPAWPAIQTLLTQPQLSDEVRERLFKIAARLEEQSQRLTPGEAREWVPFLRRLASPPHRDGEGEG